MMADEYVFPQKELDKMLDDALTQVEGAAKGTLAPTSLPQDLRASLLSVAEKRKTQQSLRRKPPQ